MANVGGPSPPSSTTHEVAPKQRITGPVTAMPRRPTRSGRLGVDKQGEYTYKKTPSSTLMASLQLGLQHSIGSIEPKPRRDILMTDFEVVDTVDFPANGSDITLAHKHRDFTFKTYSPVAFRFFREAFGILAEDYLVAMCAHPMREISNPGASGSLFYLSADDAFIIKTVQKKEAHFLQKLLPGYYLNLTQNKKTLLPKFFGLYRYKCGSVNIRIAVMNNLLPSTLRYHEKYDLKGSSYKRKATGEELRKSSPTFKDLDFQEKHEEGGVFLLQDKYDILMRTLDRDCKVLESFGIMDYSLLLGVHNIDQSRRDGESLSRTDSPGGKGEEEEKHHSLVPSRIELSKNFSIISMENIPMAVEGAQATDTSVHYPEGHIQGKVKGDRVLVYLGIIDILQSYRLKKKVEHTLKSMITDGNTVSVHNPSYYARRFSEFLEKRVFHREKVVRTRVRKPNKMQAGGVRRGPGVVRSLTMPNDARKAAAERHYAQQPPSRRLASGPTSPPLLSPPPSSEHSSGKSSHRTSTSGSSDNHLPEIPMIEVHAPRTAVEVRGKGGREERAVTVGKSPVKGVRFADLTESVDSAKTNKQIKDVKDEVTETDKRPPGEGSKDTSDVRVSPTTAKAEDGGKIEEEEEREMDSVDFDRVTGTSTPINEDSPSLPKHASTTPEEGQTFSGQMSADTTSEQEDREPVFPESAPKSSDKPEKKELSEASKAGTDTGGVSEIHAQKVKEEEEREDLKLSENSDKEEEATSEEARHKSVEPGDQS